MNNYTFNSQKLLYSINTNLFYGIFSDSFKLEFSFYVLTNSKNKTNQLEKNSF